MVRNATLFYNYELKNIETALGVDSNCTYLWVASSRVIHVCSSLHHRSNQQNTRIGAIAHAVQGDYVFKFHNDQCIYTGRVKLSRTTVLK